MWMLWHSWCCAPSVLFAEDLTDDGSLEPPVCTRSDTKYKQSPFCEPQCSTPLCKLKRQQFCFVLSQRKSLGALLLFHLFFVPFLMKLPPLPAASVQMLFRQQLKAPLTLILRLIFFCGYFVGSLQCSLPAFVSTQRERIEISIIQMHLPE